VLDFRIAKAVGLVHNTKAGEVKGKVRYMPPEQIRGHDVNRAVDVYAASVVLWEALTCSRLFGAGNDGEIVYKVMEGQIPRPTLVRPDIPPELEAIVMRGLHKNPNERFQTAKAMCDALEHAAAPVTRSTVSTWVMENAPDEIQRRDDCVARVESTVTPVPATSLVPPSGTGDSTLSRVGSLSQSLTPDPPKDAARSSRRKRVLFAVAAALTVALAALTPSLLRKTSAAEAGVAAAPLPAAQPVAAPAVKEASAAAAPPEKPAASKPEPATSAAPAEEAEASSAAQSQTARRRNPPSSSAKRSRSKGGAFDRIYRRD